MKYDSLLTLVVVKLLLFTPALYSCSSRVPSSLINFKCKSIGSVRVYLLIITFIHSYSDIVSMDQYGVPWLSFSLEYPNCASDFT